MEDALIAALRGSQWVATYIASTKEPCRVPPAGRHPRNAPKRWFASMCFFARLPCLSRRSLELPAPQAAKHRNVIVRPPCNPLGAADPSAKDGHSGSTASFQAIAKMTQVGVLSPLYAPRQTAALSSCSVISTSTRMQMRLGDLAIRCVRDGRMRREEPEKMTCRCGHRSGSSQLHPNTYFRRTPK